MLQSLPILLFWFSCCQFVSRCQVLLHPLTPKIDLELLSIADVRNKWAIDCNGRFPDIICSGMAIQIQNNQSGFLDAMNRTASNYNNNKNNTNAVTFIDKHEYYKIIFENTCTLTGVFYYEPIREHVGVTAGHCVCDCWDLPHNHFFITDLSNKTIGPVIERTFNDSGDIAIFKIMNQTQAKNSFLSFWNNTYNSQDIYADNNPSKIQMICKMGCLTNVTCGDVVTAGLYLQSVSNDCIQNTPLIWKASMLINIKSTLYLRNQVIVVVFVFV